MMKADDPVGPDNREAFDEAMDNVRDAHDEKPGPVVCAWGAHGGFMEQDLEMMRRIDACPWIKPMCLGVTTKGHARHPLYVPIRARLVPYEGRRFVASRHKTAVQATMEIEIRIRRVT